jgi:Predicted GTPase
MIKFFGSLKDGFAMESKNKIPNPFRDLSKVSLFEEIEKWLFNKIASISFDASVKSAFLLPIKKINLFSSLYSSKIFELKKVYLQIKNAHPFYVGACEFLYEGGFGCLINDLEKILQSERKIRILARNYIKAIIKEKTKSNIFLKQFLGRAMYVIRKNSYTMHKLREAHKKLNELPDIEPNVFKVAVVGAPFVGKSSLVANLTGKKLEIGKYPFTTKRINIGRISNEKFEIVVYDTPGILDRPLEKGSVYEKKAYLILKYLADFVVFLIDPTESAGYSLVYQNRILSSIKKTMPTMPILVVETHADLLQISDNRFCISNVTGFGLDDLKQELIKIAEQWYYEKFSHGPSKPQLGHL